MAITGLWGKAVLVVSVLTVALVAPALAEDVVCLENRVPGTGDCQVTRTALGLGHISQVAYKRTSEVVTLKARGIDGGQDDQVDAVVVKVEIAPGGFSRWHSRPGMSLAFMTEGRLTVYTSHGSKGCTEEIAGVGEAIPGFVQLPDQVSAYVNIDSAPAVLFGLVLKRDVDPTFVAPADQPDHPSCPFGFNP